MYFAELDQSGLVQRVIVASKEFIDSGVLGDPNTWAEVGIGNRKNYPGIGYKYDSNRNAFIAPKIYPSWVLDEDTVQWKAPKPKPTDLDNYRWDESALDWVEDHTRQ